MVVPPRGVHRDQPGGLKPGGGAVLQTSAGRRNNGLKEGKQAVAIDAAFLPPLPRQRGAAIAESDAYNLGNLWRRLALPTRVATWSLTSLQQLAG
jgi:hypothetical protein